MLTPTVKQTTIAPGMAATHQDVVVRDEVLRIGPEQQLAGILSHPQKIADPAARPGVVLLNAGVLHRVGPHRLHVHLARQLAALGFASLRLDLGGVGDSISSSNALTFRESAVADTRLAMNRLQELHGHRTFVLFGVCSGADNALATALTDHRVAGIVVVDPPTYPTRRAQLRMLRHRLRNQSPWSTMRWGLTLVERQLRERLARARGQEVEEDLTPGREIPPAETYQDQMIALTDRGVRALALYSGAHRERYNHPDQVFEALPALRGRIDHIWFPRANHTFTQLDAQGELLTAVTRWIGTKFG
jgi:dienelactone hydrolase